MKRVPRHAGLLVAAFGLALAAPAAGLATSRPAAGDAPVLVIARDPGAAVRAAGGRLVGPLSAPFAAFASGGPDFATSAIAAGAWHVLPAARLAALCGAVLPSEQQT